MLYARDFARGSLAAPNLLGVDWWQIGNATHEVDWNFTIRIFRCNHGLTTGNKTDHLADCPEGADHWQQDGSLSRLPRRPAITFENANASYLAQGLQQAGTTYHCLRLADLIHLTYVMRATSLAARSRRPVYWG